ncbi:MAG: thioredoxin domain-containing protein [Pseudohongiellaceae bacterium]
MSEPLIQIDNDLEVRLRREEKRKRGSYVERTDHLDEKGRTLFINRLILEDSPYLLQHAHNPVNWYPWGEEAFAAACAENKPVFLSIGYSTCHWCHVMEVESFDNVDIAKQLNRDFISIKLDREQYPDLDEVYMTGVQLMTGQGGWPMSSFLLGDGRPFYAGTYFPPQSFASLLNAVSAAWNEKQDELRESAAKVHRAIEHILNEKAEADVIQWEAIEEATKLALNREDKAYGGLAGAPKFPQEPLLLALLDDVHRSRDLEKAGFLGRALDGMARGGIYDQVGGGFHRYSTDAQWLAPHFEKMLYNQSQLGLAFLQAWVLFKKPFHHRVLRQTLDYVLREMQQPDGGFYSATDADSEGEEGLFFTWTHAELNEVLDEDELGFISALYNVSESGNFEGRNIFNLTQPLENFVQNQEQASDAIYQRLDAILAKLYRIREQRPHPLRDDKLIVSWASGMIVTLTRAGAVLEETRYLDAAMKAADFIWNTNRDEQDHFRRIYLDGAVSIAGQLEDYAGYCQALLALFDVSNDVSWLHRAGRVMNTTLEFLDEDTGEFFLGPAQASGPQLTRSRNSSDGATLSPVGLVLDCLVALYHRSQLLPAENEAQTPRYKSLVERAVAAVSGKVNEQPLSHNTVIRAIANFQHGEVEPVRYVEQGRARLAVSWLTLPAGASHQAELAVHIDLEPDWHLVAPGSATGEFNPLTLSTSSTEEHWQLDSVDYPDAHSEIAHGEATTLAIYESSIDLRAVFTRTAAGPDLLSNSVGIEVRLQLCDNNQCLPPQVCLFRL